MVYLRKFPSSARLEPDEYIRINRARLALELHKTPQEIDAMPYQDVEDIISVLIDKREAEKG